MYQVDVNYLAVLIAAVAAQPVGFLWYGALFGKKWRALKGIDGDVSPDQGAFGKALAIGFVAVIVEFIVLSMVFDWVGVVSIGQGLEIALIVFVGFVATIVAVGNVFSQKPSLGLFLIDGGYQLAVILVGAIILALFQDASALTQPEVQIIR
ncbi:MAG: hypothetical protein QOG62_2046 [Thermoleophilaceae bacterium]|jgi:hypothetical protein|nr:hypothetical protein [Thermoleophilaceae bacterium]